MKYLTQSMVSRLALCPQQFERIYINGERIPPGIAARRGSSTHEGIRVNHAYKLHAGEDLPVDALQDATRDEFLRLVNEKGVFIAPEDVGQKTKLLNDGLNAAVRLVGLYREEVAPAIYPVLVEERIEMDVGLPLILSGAIDCYTVDKWLPDFKTAAKASPVGAADQSMQLTWYAGLIYSRTGAWPAKCSLEVLIDAGTRHQSLETTRDASDFITLMERVTVAIAQIFSGIFPPCDPGAWICSPKWCGFYSSCKYASKRR